MRRPPQERQHRTSGAEIFSGRVGHPEPQVWPRTETAHGAAGATLGKHSVAAVAELIGASHLRRITANAPTGLRRLMMNSVAGLVGHQRCGGGAAGIVTRMCRDAVGDSVARLFLAAR